MVSRDTKVHLATIAVLLGAEYAGLLPDAGPGLGILVVVSYGAIFGGSHLYLALRGDEGMVSVRSRWRYVATLAAVLSAGIVYVVAGGVTVGPATVGTVALVVAGIAAATYLVVESIDAVRREPTTLYLLGVERDHVSLGRRAGHRSRDRNEPVALVDSRLHTAGIDVREQRRLAEQLPQNERQQDDHEEHHDDACKSPPEHTTLLSRQ